MSQHKILLSQSTTKGVPYWGGCLGTQNRELAISLRQDFFPARSPTDPPPGGSTALRISLAFVALAGIPTLSLSIHEPGHRFNLSLSFSC